jgi:hypothetical protein
MKKFVSFLAKYSLRICAGILAILFPLIFLLAIFSNEKVKIEIYWIVFMFMLSMAFARYAVRGNYDSKRGIPGWLYWLIIGWPAVFFLVGIVCQMFLSR